MELHQIIPYICIVNADFAPEFEYVDSTTLPVIIAIPPSAALRTNLFFLLLSVSLLTLKILNFEVSSPK